MPSAAKGLKDLRIQARRKCIPVAARNLLCMLLKKRGLSGNVSGHAIAATAAPKVNFSTAYKLSRSTDRKFFWGALDPGASARWWTPGRERSARQSDAKACRGGRSRVVLLLLELDPAARLSVIDVDFTFLRTGMPEIDRELVGGGAQLARFHRRSR